MSTLPQDPPIVVTGGAAPPDPPIVVTGGSVHVEFDMNILKPNGRHKHSNLNKKITRVEVAGDGINFGEDIPDGKVTVKIFFGNKNNEQ